MYRPLWLALSVAAAAVSASAQDLPPSTVPGSPPGFNYPMSYDSVRAAPSNHRIAYQDRNVRLIEVTLWPHIKEKMHGHAYPSVFAIYQKQPALDNEGLEPDQGPPPFGFPRPSPGAPEFPRCLTLGPQTPHAVTIKEEYPQHFFRLEFKRLDTSFAQNWRKWYPELAGPPRRSTAKAMAARGEKVSDAWPYPAAYETGRAAPGNYVKRFDNGLVRMYEVMIRPGETEPMHGSPYYAVNAYPSPAPGSPTGPTILERQLDPASPLIEKTVVSRTGTPKNLSGPTCTVTGPTAPHQITNTGSVPIHYYRIELLRIDGDAYPKHWKEWYPVQAKGPPVVRAK